MISVLKIKHKILSDNEVKVHVSPWDPGMAPGSQPCNMTNTKEQTPVLHRTLTQGSAEQLLLSSAAASCILHGKGELWPAPYPTS